MPYGGKRGGSFCRRMFDRGHRPGPCLHSQTLPDVLSGAIGPGPVFDRAVPLAEVPDGYRAMDDRSALKVRITF